MMYSNFETVSGEVLNGAKITQNGNVGALHVIKLQTFY